MSALLSGPNEPPEDRDDGGNAGSPKQPHGEKKGRQSSAEPRILTRTEILQRIELLNQLVFMGLVLPARANVIQRGLRMMLDADRQHDPAHASTANIDDLAALMRSDPSTLNLVTPFLTPDQVDWLLRRSQSESD